MTRPKDLQDNAVPSGNAMAATVLLKLGAFTGEGRYIDAAERALRMVQPALGSAPTGFAQWLERARFRTWGTERDCHRRPFDSRSAPPDIGTHVPS